MPVLTVVAVVAVDMPALEVKGGWLGVVAAVDYFLLEALAASPVYFVEQVEEDPMTIQDNLGVQLVTRGEQGEMISPCIQVVQGEWPGEGMAATGLETAVGVEAEEIVPDPEAMEGILRWVQAAEVVLQPLVVVLVVAEGPQRLLLEAAEVVVDLPVQAQAVA
jgi:hypothetical protein